MQNAPTMVMWMARGLGLAMAGFLGVFALDAFDGEAGLAATQAFLIQLLPAAIVVSWVMVGWRWPLTAAGLFSAAAAAYAVVAWSHPGWVLFISGPLVLTGVAFGLSARRHA